MFLPFAKYHGAGNDFILIDDRSLQFPEKNFSFIKHLCNRRLGIGADGLILLQKSSSADFLMRIFNADGYEAAMCGNGIRCLIKFLQSLGVNQTQYRIETMKSIVLCKAIEKKISVLFEQVKVMSWGLNLEDIKYELYVIECGVPHAVIFVEDIQTMQVVKEGKKIRFHPYFAPDGINVNFACIRKDGTIRVRTYERGVENETLSCGTGTAAVALAAAKKFMISSPLMVQSSAGEFLKVHIIDRPDMQNKLELIGIATLVFEGRIWVDN